MGADEVTKQTRNRWLSTFLFTVSIAAMAMAFGFWFAAIWTHGHDASTRLGGTGALAAVVTGVFAGLAVIARELDR